MSTEVTGSLPATPVVASLGTALSLEVLETAQRLGVAQYLPRVLDFTAELFGRVSRVFVMVDPEIPDDTHIVLEVPVNASIEDALDKDEKWGQRLLEAVPRAPRVYSLSMDFL